MELRILLKADPGEVSRARRAVASHLHQRGIATYDVAVLLVSELVTNALLHGRPPLELVAAGDDSQLRVEVHDASAGDPPRVRESPVDVPGGRGLRLVDALASRWGWAESGRGKFVWFELDLGA